MQDLPDILTMEQAADMLQVSTRTIQRMVKSGEIPGRQVGSQWRFDREQLRQWVRGDLKSWPRPLTQTELIEQEADRLGGADMPQMLIDLQQAARRRLEKETDE